MIITVLYFSAILKITKGREKYIHFSLLYCVELVWPSSTGRLIENDVSKDNVLMYPVCDTLANTILPSS